MPKPKPSAKRAGGFSRAGQQQEELPFTGGDLDDQDFSGDVESSPVSHSKAQPIRAQSPSSNAGGYLSSSFSHRTPIRSYSHHASHGQLENPQYSSQGVREKTQELANYYLLDSNSIRSGDSPTRNAQGSSESDQKGHSRARSSTNNSLQWEPRNSQDSMREEVIEEVSEPVSPAEPDKVSSHTKLTGRVEEDYLRERKGQKRNDVPDVVVEDTDDTSVGEQSTLLPKGRLTRLPQRSTYGTSSDNEAYDHVKKAKQRRIAAALSRVQQSLRTTFYTATHPKQWNRKALWTNCVVAPVRPLPAVFLGLLLNILDGLSYGIILFPLGEEIFKDTAADGISIFFVSTIVSQLVYTLGGSAFKGGVGSEMIEVVPFFHKMTYIILGRIGEGHSERVLATTIVAYAMSSVLTGIIFLVLGLFKLGSLVSFFPRSILTGCIGGVGLFLFVTGIEVSARLSGNLELTLPVLKKLFASDTAVLWLLPLLLAVTYLTLKWRLGDPAPLLPGYFISILAVFYFFVAVIPQLSLDDLREKGWIFEKPPAAPFYHFYTYYDFTKVDWGAIGKSIPTMLALSFFGILHVPINVPALGLAVQEDDVDTNRELIAHGISNGLSGLVGSIQNYLVYANSVFFIRAGGNSRLAGFELAVVTTAVWMAGPTMIGFIPVMIVGTLVYILGIELMQDALWSTWGKLDRLEYAMIVVITLVMGFYDFVVGIAVGIGLACFIYVLQTSRTPAIRASYDGAIAESTVRRPPIQRQFLAKVGRQIRVEKLSGYLFFGTIVAVENKIRALIDEKAFVHQPVQFLVLDFMHVTGLDFSAAEAFMRMNRILGRREVKLILSSVHFSNEVGKALTSVGLLDTEQAGDEGPVPKVFEDLNQALEYCETEMLEGLRQNRLQVPPKESQPVAISPPKTSSTDLVGVFNSPRRDYRQQAAITTLNEHGNQEFTDNDIPTHAKWQRFAQPVKIMLQTFRDVSSKNEDFWHQAATFFERKEYPAGTVLYSRGDEPDGFYMLEEGRFRAEYYLEQGQFHELILPGTTCGELPFFSETDRTGTVAAEQDSVAWLLNRERFLEMQQKKPEVATELLKICLKLTSERMNAITSYVLVMAS